MADELALAVTGHASPWGFVAGCAAVTLLVIAGGAWIGARSSRIDLFPASSATAITTHTAPAPARAILPDLPTTPQCHPSFDQFKRLSKGMTMLEAAGVMGCLGTEDRRWTMDDTTTIYLEWQFTGQYDGYMRAGFENGVLTSTDSMRSPATDPDLEKLEHLLS